MPVFYTWVILLINQSEEIGKNQLSDFGSRGSQISPLMHVALSTYIHDKVMSQIYVLFFQSTTSRSSVMIVGGANNRDLKESSPSFGLRREKTCLRQFANNTGADQPAHLRSLISAFVIHYLKSIICKLATDAISFLASLCS